MLITFLCAIPILFWLFTYDLKTRFESLNIILNSIGQISGLIGFILTSLTILISIRSKFIEKLFTSLPNIFKIHKNISILGFCFLVIHPLMFVIPYLRISFYSAINYFFSFSLSDPTTFGKLAFYSLLLILTTSLILKIKYDTWKKIHQILSFSFFSIFFHVFFIRSTTSLNLGLRIYILAFGILTILGLIYKIILGLNLSKKLKYKIVKINGKDLNEEHPFSITSTTRENNIKITIKSVGKYTENLRNKVAKNLVASIDGPYGNFYVKNNNQKIFIAGGIGITPFLSMLRNNLNEKITLFYCAKNKESTIFLEELRGLEKINDKFKLVEVISSERPRISIKDLKTVQNFQNCDIFICGPVQMLIDLKNQLIKEKFKKQKIFLEEFNLKK